MEANQLGTLQLNHRIFMCPLPRFRCPDGYPTDLAIHYYGQRAIAGGLIISETLLLRWKQAVTAMLQAYGVTGMSRWQPITHAVHANGGIFYCQLWALGRVNPGKDPKCPMVVGPSSIPAHAGRCAARCQN